MIISHFSKQQHGGNATPTASDLGGTACITQWTFCLSESLLSCIQNISQAYGKSVDALRKSHNGLQRFTMVLQISLSFPLICICDI